MLLVDFVIFLYVLNSVDYSQGDRLKLRICISLLTILLSGKYACILKIDKYMFDPLVIGGGGAINGEMNLISMYTVAGLLVQIVPSMYFPQGMEGACCAG